MATPRSYNKKFFKKWSPEMAYVLGFFFADGNIIKTKRGGYYVSFYSSEKELLVAVCGATESEHKISKRITPLGSFYRVQVGSKEWFQDLLGLGGEPLKSKRMKFPKVPKEYIKDFVRGYFDGDGNVWSGHMNSKRKNPTLALQVSFTSSSAEFLRELLTQVRTLGIKGGSLFMVKDKNASRLNFSTLDALHLYKIMYNMPHRLYLKRKKLVFEKYKRMRA